MIYYNQATGEKRYVEDSPKTTAFDGLVHLPPPRSVMPSRHTQHKNHTAKSDIFSGIKKALPKHLAFNMPRLHTENLNLEYILAHLDIDDILLGGIILLLLTDSSETDLPLILALVFLLVSEWIFDDEDNSLIPI